MSGKAKLYKSLCITCGAVFGASVVLCFVSLNFIIATILSALFTLIFGYMYSKEVKNSSGASEERKYTDEQLKLWLTNFEQFTKTAIKLERTDYKTFTKFGGMPVVPHGFIWPTFNGKPIPFLLQIDFAEINGEGKLQNFPQTGVMYVFVDSDKVNYVDKDINDDDWTYKQGETYKILYFNEYADLDIAEKPNDLKITYDEFYVTPQTVKTYPDTDDCDEANEIYKNCPVDGMEDGYEMTRYENSGHRIGGWADYVQGGGLIYTYKRSKNDNWMLLMQIESEEGDDNFMWGDVGTLYFFVNEKDLAERNFDNVRLEMQCT